VIRLKTAKAVVTRYERFLSSALSLNIRFVLRWGDTLAGLGSSGREGSRGKGRHRRGGRGEGS